MNIYEKLQEMRVKLQSMNIKKSGENRFAGYKYYELGDFMPPINQLMKDHKVCSFISFGAEEATLTIVNAEAPDESIRFTSPMKEATLKGAHAIQNLGAVETYQRRYLYMAAFEIVEADVLDATQGDAKQQVTEFPTNNRGRQNAAPRAAQQPTQQRKTNTNLPDDLSEQLNNEIKLVKQNTGKTIAEVVAEVESRTGIKMADVTVETANTILEALYEMNGLPF